MLVKAELTQFSVGNNYLHLHLVSLEGPQVPFAQMDPEKSQNINTQQQPIPLKSITVK